MASSANWAAAVRMADVLLRGYAQPGDDDEPGLLVPRIARNPVICGTATEYWSHDLPILLPGSTEEGELPIDVLYGRYEPMTQSIKIFVNRIDQDARVFGARPDELREIVRIHEHAHAVIHLGTRIDDIGRDLSALDTNGQTNWSTWVGTRTSWFSAFPSELHEFLAQALTYAAIGRVSKPARSERLREVFDALEAKQPSQYKLPANVKRSAGTADWAVVLDAARGAIDCYRDQDFTLAGGLEALVCSGAE